MDVSTVGGLAGVGPLTSTGCVLAGVGLWLVVMGGRTADVSWFLTRTDAFLNDVVILDRWELTLMVCNPNCIHMQHWLIH